MVAIEPDSTAVVEGLAERQRRQRLLEAFRDVTHRALVGPCGDGARDVLSAWGFPPGSLDRLDLGYFPDPDSVADGLDRCGTPAAQAADAGLLDAGWSGRITGPWRNPHGRIVTFFACDAGGACAAERYLCAPLGRPSTLFGVDAAGRCPVVVEGLLDVLLARCLDGPDVVGIGGPFDWLSPAGLRSLADRGVHELTLLPPDTEAGRLGVLTLLDNAARLTAPAIAVLVADPNLTVGARTLGGLLRRQGAGGLAAAVAGRVDADLYRLMMAPGGAHT